MPSIVDLTAQQPSRVLQPGDVLIAEGEGGGDLYVLLMGELAVERDGIKLATLNQPGTLVGEMSVLLGAKSTADVRATRESRVRVVRDAAKVLEAEPRLAMRVAALVAARLDATSALLVDLSKEHAGKPHEQSILSRLIGALHVATDDGAEVQRLDLFADPTLMPRPPM
ncbi:MAG: cyclic nucleotide-binding domain-containing protein [Devosia sp.]